MYNTKEQIKLLEDEILKNESYADIKINNIISETETQNKLLRYRIEQLYELLQLEESR